MLLGRTPILGIPGVPMMLGQTIEEKLRDPAWPSTEAEKKEFIELWFAHLAERESAMDMVYQMLAERLAFGVATCEELQRYNAQAQGLFLWEQRWAQILRDAGAVVRQPPYPRLFAESVVYGKNQDGTEFVEANVRCDGQGYPTSDVKANAPATQQLPCPQPPLGIAMPTPVPVPHPAWALAAFAVIGGAAYFGLGQIENIMGRLGGDEREQMKISMRETTHKQDANRAKFANDCFNKWLQGADPQNVADPDVRKQAMQQCVENASTVFPDRPEPKIESGGIGKAILWGGLGVGLALAAYAGVKWASSR